MYMCVYDSLDPSVPVVQLLDFSQVLRRLGGQSVEVDVGRQSLAVLEDRLSVQVLFLEVRENLWHTQTSLILM
jgi:hypothetical protein